MRLLFPFLVLVGLTTFPQILPAQWAKTNGLPGGSLNEMLTHGDTVVASIGSELYYSANQGGTWSAIPNPNTQILYLASSDGKNILGNAYDIGCNQITYFRTDDFFQTLHPIQTDTAPSATPFLAHGYVYLYRYQQPNRGLYRTDNDGATWELVTTQHLDLTRYDDGAQRMLSLRNGTLLQSTDQGFSWTPLLQYSGQVVRLFQQGDLICLFMFNAAQGCYVSDNQGQTWQQHTGTGFSTYYDYAALNGHLFAFGYDEPLQSSDLGQSWQPLAMPASAERVFYYTATIGNALLVGGLQTLHNAGLYRSMDEGNTWKPISFDITAASGKLRKTGTGLFAVSDGGWYRSLPDGLNWGSQGLVIPPHLSNYWPLFDALRYNGHWLASVSGTPLVSADNGVSWTESDIISNDTYFEVTDYHPLKTRILAEGRGSESQQFYISDDNGLSFRPIQTLWAQHQTGILSLEVVGTQVFALSYDLKIYLSKDACQTWALHSASLPITPLPFCGFDENALLVSGQAMIVRSPDHCCLPEVFLSSDAGQTWTNASGTLPWGNARINDLQQVGNHLVVATRAGIFFSENNGSGWEDWNENLLNIRILDIEAHQGFLWAASQGGGIWKRPFQQLGLSPEPSDRLVAAHEMPANLQLSPNPATHTVQVSTDGQTGEIEVMDALGRVLLRQTMGETDVSLDVSELPQGLYRVVFRSKAGLRQATLFVQR